MQESDELRQMKLEKLIDTKIKMSMDEFKKEYKDELMTIFLIRLSKFETAYNIGKFVVVAVAMMLIGTAYQLFISIANAQGLK